MSTPETSQGNRRLLLLAVLAVVLAGGGYLAWSWLYRPQAPDTVGAMTANNVGVGHMEQFTFDKAAASFREVTRLAPDWLPGKINLGIALLNNRDSSKAPDEDPNLREAARLFQEILQKDPENPYAHYCLGIMLEYRGRHAEAVPHFEKVTQADPKDAGGWYHLATVLPEEEKARRADAYRRAMALDPYLNGAIYGLAEIYRLDGDEKAWKKLSDESEALKQTKVWFDPGRVRYTEMGHYAEVIGRPASPRPPPVGPVPVFRPHEKLQVKLAPGARWAAAADLGGGTVGDLRRAVRERFGATLVVLDYNRDGRPDLFLLGAVVENGQVRDLLLRNDGDGAFTDVTAEAGLGGARAGLGCSVADFDNNGYPDLLITGAGRQWLFRNLPAGKDSGRRFEDVSDRAGLDKLTTVCLGATFIDLDQDGDLDLVIAQYAATAEEAVARLKGGAAGGPGLAVYLNVGEAKPAAPSVDPPPLEPRFQRVRPGEKKGLAALTDGAGAAVGLAALDLDRDNDLDLLTLADGAAPGVVLNDRLLRFRGESLPAAPFTEGGQEARGLRWNGALVLDVDRDGRSDLLLVPAGRPPLLLQNQHRREEPVAKWFVVAPTNAPPLLHAQAVDLDLDGAIDVVGLSAARQPVLLHNDGRRLVYQADQLGAGGTWPKGLVALVAGDFTGDGLPDLLAWSERGGLSLHVNQGNGNKGLQLRLSGHRRVESAGNVVRCNADGLGTRVTAQSGNLWTWAEYTTLSAGLGQSLQPVLLGLGPNAQAEVVRLRWPDLCWQAEFNQPAGALIHLEEVNRKIDSCPLLFAWDGRRFGFVADLLGAGAMGEALPGGGHRPPRPEESLKIEAGQMALKDGHYLLKVAEPGDEVTYLDRLSLVVVDHPSDVRVYPDERFTSTGPPASQDLLAFRDEVFPERARDHRGRDVTAALRHWDRDAVSGFARRTWMGLAEEHWVELDFGGQLARFGPQDRLVLCLAGWTDYPYPESIWAAEQAGVAVQAPVLERLGADGKWHTVAADAGFPAGLPRLMTLEVTGKLGGPRCVLRLRTNLQIYWDQVFVAPLLERMPSPTRPGPAAAAQTMRPACLPVSAATLAARGCVQEFSPDGRQPALYDHDRIERVPVSRLAGRLTRLGDVTELLTERDDRFVIFGPGEEVTARFDARSLPPLPPGWKRSFVLRAWGYSKSAGPFVATGDTVEPLPFHGMSNFPYGAGEHYPRTPSHEDYRRRFNTRQLGGGR
jgi:cytochrome c-type biogenesis protein CcmH/NrfG